MAGPGGARPRSTAADYEGFGADFVRPSSLTGFPEESTPVVADIDFGDDDEFDDWFDSDDELCV